MNRMVYALLGICVLVVAPLPKAHGNDGNEWATNSKPSTQYVSEPSKYCSDDGARLIYSNVNTQRSGFHPCGKISFVSLCDAEGNKWVGPSEHAPHGYLDCSIGPRIQITRHDPLPDFSDELPAIPKERKLSEPEGKRLLSDYKDYMKHLDGILDIDSKQSETAEKSTRSKPAQNASEESDLPNIASLLQILKELSSDK